MWSGSVTILWASALLLLPLLLGPILWRNIYASVALVVAQMLVLVLSLVNLGNW